MDFLGRLLFKRWGQRAAWVVLALFVLLQLAIPTLFHAPRLTLFDLYQRTASRLEHANPVVIVDIDDASLKAIGQWPWPRQLLAQLVTKILDARPVVLGIDMILPEPDRQSPEEWLNYAGDMPKELSDGIRLLPSHDAALGRAMSAGPVMIGIGGQRLIETKEDTGVLAAFRLVGTSKPPSSLPKFNAVVRSVPAIDGQAAGHGILSVDPDIDGVFRRLPLVSVIGKRLAPSMALDVLRMVEKKKAIILHAQGDAVKRLDVGKVAIPTQSDGSVWVHFSPRDERRFISAADVLAGRTKASVFDQKIVLIGVTGLGTTDLRMTPVGYMAGTEIIAQFLENVVDARIVRRPDWAPGAELALTLLLGLFLIAIVPLVGARWQTLVGVTTLIALAALGFGLWRGDLLLFDVATPAVGETLVFVSLLAGNFAESEAHRRHLRRELERQKLAAAKTEGEMEAGRRIQMGMLPDTASLAGDRRFDIGALMVPARQIGGDLYDFFKIDQSRLFFAIGDVSGKGVPAALFMALGKSLCQSIALRGETDLGEIINRANAEISRSNPEMLFITMFAGILDLDTGELRFCNAGHDAPYVLRKGETPDTIAARGGPPLCVMDDFVYETEIRQLRPGDLVCLTTDGVGEAMTAAGEPLGVPRVKAILSEIAPGVAPKTVVDELYAAVGRFVAGAEQSDDIAILALRWNGPNAP